MPRFPSAAPPKTCVETKQLAIAFLNQKGMLQPGHRLMTMTWSVRGNETGSISVESIITPEEESYLLLSYTMANGNAHEYRVDLVSVASNLPGSTASRYYLVCPVTGRRAAILYLRHGTELFAHRQAYPAKRLYYDSQLELKRYRGLTKNYQIDKVWDREFMRKYRKTTYAGKETKWLMNLEVKTIQARLLTARAILRLGP